MTDLEGEPPTYDVAVDADELLADLAARAAEYGRDYEEKRQWWRDAPAHDPFVEARQWMLEAAGGRRAYARAITRLHPDSPARQSFRREDGTVDVRGYMRWLGDMHDEAHDRAHGPHETTRQADEAESAYARMLALLRDEYGVGWPRLDPVGGTPVEEDLP